MATPMISSQDQEYIRNLFAERLTGDVTLELYTESKSPVFVMGREECQYCEETQQLLEEVAGLSDRVSLVVHDTRLDPESLRASGLSHVPAIVFRGANQGTMRFFGIPAGNEFRNLIEGIVEVSRGESDLAPETKEALAQLDEDLHIRVFITPT